MWDSNKTNNLVHGKFDDVFGLVHRNSMVCMARLGTVSSGLALDLM